MKVNRIQVDNIKIKENKKKPIKVKVTKKIGKTPFIVSPNKTKAMILYFDTEYTARLVKTDIKDGQFTLNNDKLFYVNTTKPVLLITQFGNFPLYAVRYDKILPIDLHSDEKIKVKEITPEQLKKLVQLRIIRTILTPVRKTIQGSSWLLMIIGIAIGVAITFFAPYIGQFIQNLIGG